MSWKPEARQLCPKKWLGKNPIVFACRDLGSRTEWMLSLLSRVAEIPGIGVWFIWTLTSKEAQPMDQPQKVVSIPEYRQKHSQGGAASLVLLFWGMYTLHLAS